MLQLHALPASLLALLGATLLQISVAQHLPALALRDVRGASSLERRLHQDAVASQHAEIEARLSTQTPIGITKMSDDPSEKFWPEYWLFDETQTEDDHEHSRSKRSAYNNITQQNLQPPLLLHLPQTGLRLAKRGYQCPTGYHNCASIGETDSCCSSDQTCQVITNSGIGTVGCCPSGEDCTGSVSTCDTAQGYTNCPNSRNKNGCCSPGFVCDDVGCINAASSSAVVVVAASAPPAATTITSTAVVIAQPSTVYLTTTTPTATVIISPAAPSTATVIVTTTITSNGAIAPVRPTSAADTVLTTTTATVSDSMCPTNYYRCSAYYLGGCCRVGRDCSSTHCPTQSSTAIITDGVVTVIVATGVGVTTISLGASATATADVSAAVVTTTLTDPTTTLDPGVVVVGANRGCPSEWYSCAAAQGGGCCPDGYACGVKATCSATQGGLPKKVVKVSGAAVLGAGAGKWGYWMIGLAGVVGVGMVLL